jgi:hypothetical protein
MFIPPMNKTKLQRQHYAEVDPVALEAATDDELMGIMRTPCEGDSVIGIYTGQVLKGYVN